MKGEDDITRVKSIVKELKRIRPKWCIDKKECRPLSIIIYQGGKQPSLCLGNQIPPHDLDCIRMCRYSRRLGTNKRDAVATDSTVSEALDKISLIADGLSTFYSTYSIPEYNNLLKLTLKNEGR